MGNLLGKSAFLASKLENGPLLEHGPLLDQGPLIEVLRSFDAYFLLTLYLIETPFNTFANRADTDQAALTRAA